MQNPITETLLEMHFFKAIVADLLRLFGENVQFVRLLKPSPQKEAWVGFDQGWVFTTVSTQTLFQQISDAVENKQNSISSFYLGYFLQFKIVEYVNTPADSELRNRNYGQKHYRSKLSLKPNKTTKISQHETLVRVSNIQNARVSYACPMLFDIEDIFKKANIQDLRCVDIVTAPMPDQAWLTQKNHYIVFRTKYDSSPDWCSEPHEGTALSFSDWARRSLRELSGQELRDLLLETSRTVSHPDRVELPKPLSDEFEIITSFVPECFTILELRRQAETNTNL